MRQAPPTPLPLAHLPTPLQPLPRLSRALGVELLVKRDDLTDSHAGGNKLRKLAYLLAQARREGATHVITCGGIQSNHARATALSARPLGMQPVLLLRTPRGLQEELEGTVTGNLLLDRIAGAELHAIDPAAYRARRGEIMASMAADLRDKGARPFIIPEGGSDALGALGYRDAARETVTAMADKPPDAVVVATGSGGTLAGLALGLAELAPACRAFGVAVCDDAAYFTPIVRAIIDDATRRFGSPASAREGFEVLDGFQGRGYALSTPEELTFLAETAREDGLVLDPVYTNKAFLGLVTTLQRDPKRFGRRVVFVHTGGIFGLFAHAEALEGALRPLVKA